MGDVHSKEIRSYNMSRIRAKNTKPEILARKYLFSRGLRYRIHVKLPGKPDIVFPKFKVALFINGCFWHGHAGCKYFVMPKTRSEWWNQKISGNEINDKKKIRALEALGWKAIVIWECQLKANRAEQTLCELYDHIHACT